VASIGFRRSLPLPVVVATVVAGIVAGCATVPSTNTPRQVLTGGNAVQAYVRPLPPPPPSSGQYKSPSETVLGFLAASATYAYDPAAARQFLSPALRKTWRPGPVTVVSSLGRPKGAPASGKSSLACRALESTCAQFSGKPSAGVDRQSVDITAQHLATLSPGGQYEPNAGTSNYTFSLAKPKNGVWLITKLPADGLHNLLLTKASFEEVYQPRNLFFFARQGTVVNGELVPDPVYAPLQSANNALNTDVAAGLVKGLLSDPTGWLSDATTTAFPPGTTLVKVTLRGQVAIVDLGGAAKNASAQRLNQMEAQLLATLDSKAYSSPLAHNVVLYIDGRKRYTSPNSNPSRVVLGQLVYQSGPDTVSEVTNNSKSPSTLALPRQIGFAQITATAATEPGAVAAAVQSEVGAVAVAVQSGAGCAVYIHGASGGPYHSYHIPDSAGACSSLSWDRNGNLWAVAGGHIWVLRPSRTHYQLLAVRSPGNLPPDGKSGPNILSMQMAPDGVRAALLVKSSDGNRVLLTAVVFSVNGPKAGNGKGRPEDGAEGTAGNADGSSLSVSLGAAVQAWPGLSRPTALSWYNSYELVVLTRNAIWQVPLTGAAGRLLGNAPAGAMSLATNGAALAVGTSDHGQYGLEVSRNGGNSWQSAASATSFPTYPTYMTWPTP